LLAMSTALEHPSTELTVVRRLLILFFHVFQKDAVSLVS